MSIQGQETGQPYVFFDVDGTLVDVDTGQELFHKAGKCERDEFFRIMEQTHAPGMGEPESGRGNELLETLAEKPEEEVSELERAARRLEAEPKPGLKSAVKEFSKIGHTVVAHSAGWAPAIEEVTNGDFDEKFAGRLTQEGPEFNGRYQKPVKMQNHLVNQGKEPVETETVFVGDSDTDLEAIRYAAATEGYGIALSDTVKNARERVTEASVYVGCSDGDYAAALLHCLTSDEDTEEFVNKYDLDLSGGYAEPGELAESSEELNQAIKYIEDLK